MIALCFFIYGDSVSKGGVDEEQGVGINIFNPLGDFAAKISKIICVDIAVVFVTLLRRKCFEMILKNRTEISWSGGFCGLGPQRGGEGMTGLVDLKMSCFI